MILVKVILLSLLSLPVWISMFVLRTILIVLGHIMIPIAMLFKAYEVRQSKFYDKKILTWTWDIMYLWGNEEDGIDGGPGYPFNGETWSQTRKIWTWTAVRNPVNNLRFVRPFSFKYDNVKDIKWIGTEPDALKHQKVPNYYFASYKFYSCFRVHWTGSDGKLKEFWVGWKIRPSNAITGVSPYQVPGVGFTSQISK